MLVDALANRDPAGRATESTVQGPFYVPGSPLRSYGERLDETPAGEPLWVHGTVRSLDGRPLAGAELDVWQNGDNELYAVQDADAPENHLRGRFLTRDDGSYAFLTVRPTPYPIPHDGPVGHMLSATGRHPWRPAHIHVIVRAAGHRPVTTHVFDRGEQAHRRRRRVRGQALAAAGSGRPPGRRSGAPPGLAGVTAPWWSLASDFRPGPRPRRDTGPGAA